MAKEVSRRNRRTVSIRNALALLAVATCIFLGGLASFAWAVGSVQARDTAPPETSTRAEPAAGTGDAPQSGVLLYPGAEPASKADTQDAESADADTSKEADAAPGTSTSERTVSDAEASSSSSGSGAAHSPAQEKRTKTIHHTAYRRVPVYRTLAHKAAAKHTETVDGQTVVTWMLCPVCGQRHSESYTQKVLDHYENVYCAACGKKHGKSYTETIAY